MSTILITPMVRCDDPNDMARLESLGLLAMANRVLHPFGIAIAVLHNAETRRPVALTLLATDEPCGIVSLPGADN